MKALKFILCFMLILSLTGCENAPKYIEDPSLSHLSRQQQKDLVLIQKMGVQLVKQGMQFTFIIPVDCFFVKETRELKEHRHADLVVLSRFIQGYISYFARPHIDITGYTDTTLLNPARQKLSFHYAETIAFELEENGIADNFIKVSGDGAAAPIASNSYPMGAAFNRRVVIIIH